MGSRFFAAVIALSCFTVSTLCPADLDGKSFDCEMIAQYPVGDWGGLTVSFADGNYRYVMTDSNTGRQKVLKGRYKLQGHTITLKPKADGKASLHYKDEYLFPDADDFAAYQKNPRMLEKLRSVAFGQGQDDPSLPQHVLVCTVPRRSRT